MGLKVKLIVVTGLLCWSFGSIPSTNGGVYGCVSSSSSQQSSDTKEMIQPSDLFRNFPQLSLGMPFRAARQEIEKTGANPIASGRDETEIVWDGKFNELQGRGTILFKEDSAFEIAVVVQAFEKRDEIFEQWFKMITGQHGKPNEESDNTVHLSRVWRLKNGVTIELRRFKEPGHPVVDVHWVK